MELDRIRQFQRQVLLRTYGEDGHVLSVCIQASEAIEALIGLLNGHHQHHLQKGTIGLPDGEGGWVEIDNGAEYSDSTLCEQTDRVLTGRRDPDPTPATLTPLHIKLLQRGANGRYIGLSDNAGIRVGEVVALGELHRMGLAEDAPGPFPPGPPSLTPSVITEAGRAALREADPGRLVPPHGSGPDNV